MGKREDLTGQKFNRLTVIGEVFPNTSPIKWICQCDCGNNIEARGSSLKNGNTKSCGCYAREVLSKMATVHGARKTPLYRTHSSMMTRCYNTNNPSYQDYGKKGITVCDTWKSFVGFQQWALNSGYKDGLSIDRINPEGNYAPDNCRWTDKTIQARNRKKHAHGITSKYIGVSWNTQQSKWNVTICVNKIPVFLGRYTDEIEAAKVRDTYILQNCLEGFTLNFN